MKFCYLLYMHAVSKLKQCDVVGNAILFIFIPALGARLVY